MKNFNNVLAGGFLLLASATTLADQVILDDLIVDGSSCVGQDCVNGESFGFDTIRLKENNLRIKFQDTSNSASFPTNDWQLTANDSTNGGANKFSIDDIDGGKTPFTIEAGAPSHSLYVDDGGRLGLGTSTPVVDVHVKTGNTPTLRLEQDGSSGFTAQTWDVAANETNFFVRDATNGSTLPFRIFPGAPSNALTIEATTGDIGVGTTSPLHSLQIKRSGPVKVGLTNAVNQWILNSNNTMRITTGGATAEMTIQPTSGDVTILGTLTTGGVTCGGGCDLVFAPETEIESIDEHASQMWSNRYLPSVGPTIENMPLNLSEKTGGMLNELEKAHIYIEQLHKRLERLEEEQAELKLIVKGLVSESGNGLLLTSLDSKK